MQKTNIRHTPAVTTIKLGVGGGWGNLMHHSETEEKRSREFKARRSILEADSTTTCSILKKARFKT